MPDITSLSFPLPSSSLCRHPFPRRLPCAVQRPRPLLRWHLPVRLRLVGRACAVRACAAAHGGPARRGPAGGTASATRAGRAPTAPNARVRMVARRVARASTARVFVSRASPAPTARSRRSRLLGPRVLRQRRRDMRLRRGLRRRDCAQRLCPGGCSGHGVCHPDGECECDEGWVAPSCAERTCAAGAARGACVNGTCVCRSGWSGDACEVADCPNLCSHRPLRPLARGRTARRLARRRGVGRRCRPGRRHRGGDSR